MICFPTCKINIGLFVTNKRNDGYHDLETVFYPVIPDSRAPGTVLNDVLEIVPAHADHTILHISGLEVTGAKEQNLVWKAYELLKGAHPDRIHAVDIYLHKAIPMGAGLGGGSADGAFMLRLMNDYFGLGLEPHELASLALQLGSDCPFFIYNTPQFAQGRGERMVPVQLDLSAYRIEVICPDIHVSTKDAFSRITPKPASFALTHIGALPIEQWKQHIRNDFETTVFNSYPQLAEIKQQLYDQGAVYASMTGTGSAVYGIFKR